MVKKKQKQVRAVKPVVPALHYSIIIALVISNITSLGLAFLMAQLLGVSMGNIAIIGATQGVNQANAQVLSMKQNQMAYPVPGGPSCDARWAVCSQACDDQYTAGIYTPGGWNRCEKDCDLRLLNCNVTGQWMDEIKVRDTKFKPE